MRIVYILTSLGIGGAERVALDLAERMTRRGHEVAFLVLRPRLAEGWATELRVVHMEMRKTPVSLLLALKRGRQFLRELRPDVVHSHSFHANLVERLLRVLVPSVKVVSTVHNVYEGGWRRMLAYRLTDPLASRTTAVSEAAADRFVEMKAVSRQRCIALGNGIDIDAFTPSAERRARTRAAMEVGGDSSGWRRGALFRRRIIRTC